MLLSGGGVEILYVFSPLFFEVSCLGCACNLPWCPLPSHPWNVGALATLVVLAVWSLLSCFHLLQWNHLRKLLCFRSFLHFSCEKHKLSGSLAVLLWQSRGLVSLQCELRLRASDPFTNDTRGSRRLECWRLHQRLKIKRKCVHFLTYIFSEGRRLSKW